MGRLATYSATGWMRYVLTASLSQCQAQESTTWILELHMMFVGALMRL